jgi:hypothetical protein
MIFGVSDDEPFDDLSYRHLALAEMKAGFVTLLRRQATDNMGRPLDLTVQQPQ